VCLVTGASRGIGKGIAIGLGQAGAIVYLTGRSKEALDDCANAIDEAGGEAHAIVMDHSIDDEVKALFEKIDAEQKGRLDLLVNNAFSAGVYLRKNTGLRFWELRPEENWSQLMDVGVRNAFICTTRAAKMMVENERGLILNLSSAGALYPVFSLTYGVSKATLDKMTADAAYELKERNVSVVSMGSMMDSCLGEMSRFGKEKQLRKIALE